MRLIRLLKKDLAKETSEWVDEGIISLEQAQAISARYGLDYNRISESSFGYVILVGLGYLFIGLALITLLSANWEEIPRGLRMSGLVVLTLVTHLLGIRKYLAGQLSSATGVFFLGCMFYGASIMLIAQIYHIDEHFPDGILWWGLGVLPFAIFLRSTLLMLLATTLGFVWLFVESSLNYFPSLFLVFMGAAAWHVFRVKQSFVLFMALAAGLGLWTEFLLAWIIKDNYRFDFGAENVIYCISLFIFFSGTAKWLNGQSDHKLVDYGTVLGIWSLRFSIITLLVFSFEAPWEELINADWQRPVLIFVLAIVLSSSSLLLARSTGSQVISLSVISGFFILCLLALFQSINTGFIYLGIYFQVATNIILVLSGVWLIVRGIKEGTTHYFYLGILTILLVALLRYIDLVGDYVGAAILFIIFAVILLTTAGFWKKYKNRFMEQH